MMNLIDNDEKLDFSDNLNVFDEEFNEYDDESDVTDVILILMFQNLFHQNHILLYIFLKIKLFNKNFSISSFLLIPSIYILLAS